MTARRQAQECGDKPAVHCLHRTIRIARQIALFDDSRTISSVQEKAALVRRLKIYSRFVSVTFAVQVAVAVSVPRFTTSRTGPFVVADKMNRP